MMMMLHTPTRASILTESFQEDIFTLQLQIYSDSMWWHLFHTLIIIIIMGLLLFLII